MTTDALHILIDSNGITYSLNFLPCDFADWAARKHDGEMEREAYESLLKGYTPNFSTLYSSIESYITILKLTETNVKYEVLFGEEEFNDYLKDQREKLDMFERSFELSKKRDFKLI